MAANEQLREDPAPDLERRGPVAVAAASRMQAVLRAVNKEIARRANGNATAAFVCECEDRGCAEALEAPLSVFVLAASKDRHQLVRPGHEEPLADRVVSQGPDYLVVVRTL
jgi:hypothetical protein